MLHPSSGSKCVVSNSILGYAERLQGGCIVAGKETESSAGQSARHTKTPLLK